MDEELWAPIVPAGPVREERARRLPLVLAAVALVAAAVPVGWFVLGGRDDGGRRDVVAAASHDDEAVPESVRAFVERWNAPTTTASTLPRTTTAPPAPATTARGAAAAAASPRTATLDARALAEAEAAARRFVDAMTARDCEGVWSLLSSATIRFLEAMSEESEEPVKDSFCTALRDGEVPVITVRAPARAVDADRAVVDLEAGGDVEPLLLVREVDRAWRVDLLGAESGER